MEIIKNILNKNRTPLFIAVVIWFTTTVLQIDRAFFVYDNENKILVVVKILYLNSRTSEI